MNRNDITNFLLTPADQRRGVSTAVLLNDGDKDQRAVVGKDAAGLGIVDTDAAKPIFNRDIPDYVANPGLCHFFNTDCLSCHTETTLRTSQGLPKSKFEYLRPAGVSSVDVAVLPGRNPWNIRNFGWFQPGAAAAKATVSMRTANETADCVEFINREVSGPKKVMYVRGTLCRSASNRSGALRVTIKTAGVPHKDDHTGHDASGSKALSRRRDRRALSPRSIAALYGLRWDVETNIRHLKTTMKLEVLKSQSVEGIKKEVLVFTLVYNLVRLVMLEAARRQKVLLSRISFIDALRWLRCPGSVAFGQTRIAKVTRLSFPTLMCSACGHPCCHPACLQTLPLRSRIIAFLRHRNFHALLQIRAIATLCFLRRLLCNAKAAVAYLSVVDYFANSPGEILGKGFEHLGIERKSARNVFECFVHNLDSASGQVLRPHMLDCDRVGMDFKFNSAKSVGRHRQGDQRQGQRWRRAAGSRPLRGRGLWDVVHRK